MKIHDKNSTSILVLQGYVMGFTKGGQGKRMTIISCPTAGRFLVQWKNDTLPEGVKAGRYVTFTGKLITLNLGKSFKVVSAESLQSRTLNEIKKFIETKKAGVFGG